MSPWIRPILLILILLVLWDLTIRVFHIPPYLIPAPEAVVKQLIVEWPRLLRESAVTTYATLGGFALSVAFGIPGTQVMNNTNSTADIDCFRISSATRWLGIQVTNDPAAAGSLLRVDSAGSEIPTELAVYRFIAPSCLQSVVCMHTNIMGCDTNSAGGSYSLLQFTPELGGAWKQEFFSRGADRVLWVAHKLWFEISCCRALCALRITETFASVKEINRAGASRDAAESVAVAGQAARDEFCM